MEDLLEAVRLHREADDVRFRLAQGYSFDRRHKAEIEREASLRQLGRVTVAISAMDERLGLLWRIRYVEGHTFAQTCKYLRVGRSTMSRYKRALMRAISMRPDVIAALEDWLAGDYHQVHGRHRMPG